LVPIRIQGLIISLNSSKGFSLTVKYRSQAISQAEIDLILDHFTAVLIFLTSHPHDIIGDVNLIDENERHRLVNDISPGELNPAQNISELIEVQTNKTPEKIAVRVSLTSLSIKYHLISCIQLQFDQDVFLTYRQMDSLSNDLAHMLITKGVKKGTLIGLYMDKSIEMFLAIIAIHKAGGGYVPLDPEHPTERIQTIVHLAQTPMVLTIRELENQLISVLLDTGINSVSVDYTELTPSTKPSIEMVCRDDICHVLFTSGSTGTPKGIQLACFVSISNC
jgi:non-ribosomal peptide synthetase component F